MLFIYHLYLHTIYISFYFLHAAFYGSLSCTFISKAQWFTYSGTFFCIFIQWPIYLFYVWGKKPVLAEQTGLQRSMSPSSAAFSRAGRKQRCRCVPERMKITSHFTVCSQRELKWAGYLFCKTRGKYYVWKLLRRSKFKMSRFHNITARLNVTTSASLWIKRKSDQPAISDKYNNRLISFWSGLDPEPSVFLMELPVVSTEVTVCVETKKVL